MLSSGRPAAASHARRRDTRCSCQAHGGSSSKARPRGLGPRVTGGPSGPSDRLRGCARCRADLLERGEGRLRNSLHGSRNAVRKLSESEYPSQFIYQRDQTSHSLVRYRALFVLISRLLVRCWQREKIYAQKMSFKSIPVLDLALADDPATKPAFLKDLREALMEVGFLYIKNVGISDELFGKVVSLGRAFFDIPLEEK